MARFRVLLVASVLTLGAAAPVAAAPVAAAPVPVARVSTATAPAARQLPTTFDIRDLGSVDGESPRSLGAEAVNARGEVAGSAVVSGEVVGFVWSPRTGTMTTFEPVASVGDINSRGEVVGTVEHGDETFSAFVRDPRTGELDELGTLGGSFSAGRALNDRGLAVGLSSTAVEEIHAFVHDPRTGVMTDLGTLGGEFSAALDINSRGEVVGEAADADGWLHAFFWSPRTLVMTDLGVLPGKLQSTALSINDLGQVIGHSYIGENSTLEAFVWTASTGMQTIPGLTMGQAFVSEINGLGVVAGTRVDDGVPQPFLWDSATSVFVDLPTFGGAASASGISDRLHVVGTADVSDGQAAVLWTPRRGG